jgi:protein-S-isoprenylcysteine O-methyltransferase Ste14
MAMYVILICIILTIWISFEILLVVRDRMQGKGTTGNDRGTRYLNFIAIIVGITIAGIISGNTKFFFPGGRSEIGFWIGLCIMLMGFGLRVWAVVTLGVSFRTTVETHTDQRVIRIGPYRIVRHPIIQWIDINVFRLWHRCSELAIVSVCCGSSTRCSHI